MATRILHIACYDVACAARLRAALAVSRQFATGGQKSVHECWLDSREHSILQGRLANVIDADEDRALIVRLDGRRNVVLLGAARSPADSDCIVVGAA